MVNSGYTKNHNSYNTDNFYMYLLLHINNILIATKDKSKINRLKIYLNGEFKMKDLCLAEKILGWRSTEIGKQINCTCFRKMYVQDVLECFCMDGSKSESISLAAHFKLSAYYQCRLRRWSIYHMFHILVQLVA